MGKDITNKRNDTGKGTGASAITPLRGRERQGRMDNWGSDHKHHLC